MPLPIQTDFVVPDIFHSREAKQYAAWLKEFIKTLHDMVRINRIESTQQMKQDYDTKHNIQRPDFKIGDLVLLRDIRIPAGSNKILTKRPYVENPYVIKQIVSSHGAGPAYKITVEQTVKDLCGLVTHDRLQHLSSSLVRNQAASSSVKTCFKRAIKIPNDRAVKQVHQFLVFFKDKHNPEAKLIHSYIHYYYTTGNVASAMHKFMDQNTLIIIVNVPLTVDELIAGSHFSAAITR